MTTNADKLVQMARECRAVFTEQLPISSIHPSRRTVTFEIDELAAFAAAHVASLCADVEPVAWIWKYANGEEEVVFVDSARVQWDPDTHDIPTKVTPLYPASTVASLTAQRNAALARVAELEKDAARYRWLRDKAVWLTTSEKAPWCVIGTCANDAQPCDRDELDTAIDAALTKGQP